MLKNRRAQSFQEGRLGKYLLYAIGEILLIIIGVLIAVNINGSIKSAQESKLKCIYLKELLYTFEYDIKDVKENLSAFKRWNPKIKELLVAINNKRLMAVDSLPEKLGTVGNYIVFGQRSKTKIEELKYSSIDLIDNRKLKNEILLYQDGNIAEIRHIEKGYQLIGQDLRQYYARNFNDFNYTKAIPADLAALAQDRYYYGLVLQRLRGNVTLASKYEQLNAEQKAIKELILSEIEKNCGKG